MLSENALEFLATAIALRQEEINQYVISVIVKRVREIGTLKASDVYKLERLLKSGTDVKKINAEVSRLTGLSVKEIKKTIYQVAKSNYIEVKPFYDYRNKPFVAFEDNAGLQRIVKAIAQQTAETYINLSRSRAFMLRDPKNPQKFIPTSLSKTYYTVIDEAVQASQSGVVDYNTAMRRTLQQLSDSGIRTVRYHTESGKVYSQTMEAAVKRNILDGIRQINQAVQDFVGQEYGADGKEITVHEMSAPDHEPIQGHQFTNEEYEKLQNSEDFHDVNGVSFEAIDRAIGEYNCHHFTYSIIIGVNKPNYTSAELEANIARNHKGYTDASGKHLTLYECSQEQRRMERQIRRAKTLIMTGKNAGDTTLLNKGKATLVKWQKEYRTFSKACGLTEKSMNTRVQGYKR